MKNGYEMVTVKAFLDSEDAECTTISEKEIEKQVEKYLLKVRRNEVNAEIVESLLA